MDRRLSVAFLPAPRDGVSCLVNDEPPEARLKELAEIAHAKVINKELRDPDKIKKLCAEFGTREVVGTGLGMDITTVLTHLSEYTNLIESLQTPEHGGDRESVEAISGNDINFQHNAYYALQSFYGSAIFSLVIHKMEIFNTEVVLEDPISRDVYDHFYGHLSE